METLRDVLARDRRGDAPALQAPTSGRAYDYRRLCTTAWKVGNFLRHLGVRRGTGVGVAAEHAPEPVLSFLGAGLVGAVVRFDPPPEASPRATVVPAARLDERAAAPGETLVAYGADPADPSVASFERDVWSENPTMPPGGVAPDDDLLAAGDRRCAQATVLAAADGVAGRWDLGPGDRVAVRAPLTEPGTVAAGVVAPLVAGATVLLPAGDAVGDAAVAVGDAAVAAGDAPGPQRVVPGDVL